MLDFSDYYYARERMTWGIGSSAAKVRLRFRFKEELNGKVFLDDLAYEKTYDAEFTMKKEEDGQYHVWIDFVDKLNDTRLERISYLAMAVGLLSKFLSVSLHP